MAFNNILEILMRLNHFAAYKSQDQLKAELLNAVFHGETILVMNLVNQEHAPVNFTTTNGWSPLGLAAQRGHFFIMKFLIESGANVNVNIPTGMNSLHLLASNSRDIKDPYYKSMMPLQSLDMIKLLVAKGIAIDATDSKGYTALHIAVMSDNFRTTKLLIELGAGVEVHASSNGYTPLHMSALNGNLSITELLLENGSDIHTQDWQGNTPRSLLSSYEDEKHLSVYKYLLSLEPPPAQEEQVLQEDSDILLPSLYPIPCHSTPSHVYIINEVPQPCATQKTETIDPQLIANILDNCSHYGDPSATDTHHQYYINDVYIW